MTISFLTILVNVDSEVWLFVVFCFRKSFIWSLFSNYMCFYVLVYMCIRVFFVRIRANLYT